MKKSNKHFTIKIKFISGLVILAIILSVVLGIVIANRYRKSMEEYYSKIAFDEAKIASQMINGDTIAGYADTLQKDDYYDEISNYLLRVKQTIGLKYIYVIVPLRDTMFYIWDAGVSGEQGVCDLGDFDDYYGDGQKLMHRAFEEPDGEAQILITRNEEYGYLASAYVAVKDSSGQPVALAGVDISMDLINEQINNMLLIIILIISGILIAFIITYYFIIRKIIIVPIVTLGKTAEVIAGSEVSALETISIDIHTKDELQTLAESFEDMAKKLYQNITSLNIVTAEKERIGAELDVATKIQASMLPRIFPAFPERGDMDIFASMQPAKEVGGDFYDFFLINDNTLGIVMADVSGKGVPAALFMVIGKTLLKNNAQYGKSPKDVFETVNNILCENNDAELFITAFMGFLDLTCGKFTYVNAGHNPPLMKRKDGLYEYMKLKPGVVLAAMEDMPYTEFEMILNPGDMLYLYTDGLTEALNPKKELYGEDRLFNTANALKTDDPREICILIKEDIDKFTAGAEQADDITMLAIKYAITDEAQR